MNTDGIRKSARISERAREVLNAKVYRMTVKTSLKKHGDIARDALIKELGQMITKDVFEYVDFKTLTKAQRKNVICSSIFMNEKYNAKGVIVKLKARLVAGGNQQDKSIFSPTISQESVMMVVAIAATEDRSMETCDVTGAFLEAEMPMNCEVLMSLDAVCAKLLILLDPSCSSFILDDGVLHVRLRGALYGCVQSSKLWSDKLCKVLFDNGFVANPYDECV